MTRDAVPESAAPPARRHDVHGDPHPPAAPDLLGGTDLLVGTDLLGGTDRLGRQGLPADAAHLAGPRAPLTVGRGG